MTSSDGATPRLPRDKVRIKHVAVVAGLAVALALLDGAGLVLPYVAPRALVVSLDDVSSGRLGPVDVVWQGALTLCMLLARVLLVLLVVPVAALSALWCLRCAALAVVQRGWGVAGAAAGGALVCAALTLLPLVAFFLT